MQKANLLKLCPGQPAIFWMGMERGFKLALRTLYPNAEQFINEDPAATQLVLTAAAIEECAKS